MQDAFKRTINYLRLSLTDRCNLRCRYCMPQRGLPMMGQRDMLQVEEIVLLAACATELGINRFRLTGGEPLVRKDMINIVEKLAEIPGVKDLSMTTNGILLGRYARDLKAAGLGRVNISLDTLDQEKYRYITRGGDLHQVLGGLRAAVDAGMDPVKVNVVMMRGFNDHEIIDFARLAQDRALHVRFIELMPIGNGAKSTNGDSVSVAEARNNIQNTFGSLMPQNVSGNGPASYYGLGGLGGGTIGFIGALSEHYCHGCNRLRLTADGKLLGCLHSEKEVDLLGVVRRGAAKEEILRLFRLAVLNKPERHMMSMHSQGTQQRLMSQIGG